MKLALVNGSPRGKKSNSDRIIGWLSSGDYNETKVYVSRLKKQDESIELIEDADSLLIVFPLYTDSMPGLMKSFFEKMAKKDFSGKTVTFVIHSGFSEALHSRAVQKYCEYFAKLCGMRLLGCVVMGGSEALQVASDKYFGKRFKAFAVIKQNILDQVKLDESALRIIAKREKFSKFMILLLKILPTEMYWNTQFKKNGVYDKRFNRPYL